MSGEISKGMKVKVTGTYERGVVGVVTAVQSGWCSRTAVISVSGAMRSREVRVPVTDVTPL